VTLATSNSNPVSHNIIVAYDNLLTSVRKHVSINSILFDHIKHHYRNCNSPVKNFRWHLELDRP